jgi:DNA-binding NarL/FixJ family response regulator
MTVPTNDPSTPCVLLVEDSRELASAIRRTLKARGFTVVLATNNAEARVLIEHDDVRLDAAVLDHRLPDGDSLELVAALVNREPSCASVVLTAHGEDDVAREYLRRGAFRYATKPVSGTQLVVLVGDTVHHTHRWRHALGQGPHEPPPPPAVLPDLDHAAERLRHVARLSPTETIVARFMLEGLRDAEIAQKLGRAQRTVKRHVSHVLAKTGVKNRASLWSALGQDGEPCPRGDEVATADDRHGTDDEDDGAAGRAQAPEGRARPRAPPSP